MRFIVPGLILAFTIYCLIDVIRSEDSEIRGLPKIVWVMLVLLFPVAGGAAWFLAGRPRGSRPPGTDRITRPKPRVTGPDDDPDFLRTIDRPRPVDPPAALEDEVAEDPVGQDPDEHGPDAPGTEGQDDRRT